MGNLISIPRWISCIGGESVGTLAKPAFTRSRKREMEFGFRTGRTAEHRRAQHSTAQHGRPILGVCLFGVEICRRGPPPAVKVGAVVPGLCIWCGME